MSTDSEAKDLVLKALSSLKIRYRLFATGFLLSIGLMAVSVYFIHPGLASLIIFAYLTYFMRVNLLNTDGQRQHVEQIIVTAYNQTQAQKIDPLAEHHKGAYL